LVTTPKQQLLYLFLVGFETRLCFVMYLLLLLTTCLILR
ncbi:hypothetical protein ACMD2_16464, partial [Ananas comosus]